MRILNSRGFKFANISENKVLVNNSEFTVMYLYIKFCPCYVQEFATFDYHFHLRSTLEVFWTMHNNKWATTWQNNNVAMRPARSQITLGIRPVWSESSLSAWRKLGSLATHWAHSEVSDQTGRMPRLIWVFAGRTYHFVGFVVRRLKCRAMNRIKLKLRKMKTSEVVNARCFQYKYYFSAQ